MDLLPSPIPGTALRVLSTSDLGATTLPLRANAHRPAVREVDAAPTGVEVRSAVASVLAGR